LIATATMDGEATVRRTVLALAASLRGGLDAAGEGGRSRRAGTATVQEDLSEPPDEAAFTALYDELARPLAAYARRTLGDSDEAHDVVQETFYRYLRQGMPAGTTTADARPYLYRVTTHLLRDRWRRAAVQRRWWEQSGPPEESVAPRDQGLARDVERAMRALKPRDRALLWLAHVEGASHREIAANLEIGEGSVRVMLFRARNRLQKALEEQGFPLREES
jgi:RNA polymerase sigma-70 factor (ECF subfamily)